VFKNPALFIKGLKTMSAASASCSLLVGCRAGTYVLGFTRFKSRMRPNFFYHLSYFELTRATCSVGQMCFYAFSLLFMLIQCTMSRSM